MISIAMNIEYRNGSKRKYVKKEKDQRDLR